MDTIKNQRIYPCDICSSESVVTAVVWCPYCEEFLCTDCIRHHFRSKISKYHKTLTIQEYNKLPKALLSIQSKCADHNEKFEYFCQIHKHSCCVKCLSKTHVDCRNLQPLHEVINSSKTQATIAVIEQKLERIYKNLDEIVKSCSSKLEKLDKQKESCLDEVHRTRQLINRRLDSIEYELKEELNTRCSDVKTKTEKLKVELTTDREKIKGLLTDMGTIKHLGTDFQTFLFGIETENSMKEVITDLEELRTSGALDDIDLQLHIDSLLLSFINNTCPFGTLSFHHFPIGLDILSLHTEQRESNHRILHDIEKITLVLKDEIALPKSENVTGITGCKIFNSGDLMFVDFENKRLVRKDKNKLPTEIIRFTSSPRDVTIVDNTTVAVTIRDEHNVVLIDLNTNKVLKTFDVTSPCYGIDRVDDKLVVRLNHTGQFLVLDTTGNTIKRLHVPGYYIQDMTLFNGKIFCTNCENHKVYCYDMSGDLIWTFSDELLRKPYGLGVDLNGNIYVAGMESKNVVVISPDSHRSKELLSIKHGDHSPYALHVNTNSNQLLVCNEFGGKAHLYDII